MSAKCERCTERRIEELERRIAALESRPERVTIQFHPAVVIAQPTPEPRIGPWGVPSWDGQSVGIGPDREYYGLSSLRTYCGGSPA